MEPETESPPPIHPALEGRPGGTSFAFVRNALLVGVFLLLCILASDLAINYYLYNSSGLPGPGPWWFQLAFPALILSWMVWIFSMGLAFLGYTSSKMGCRGPIALLGGLNILLALLLFFLSIITWYKALLIGGFSNTSAVWSIISFQAHPHMP